MFYTLLLALSEQVAFNIAYITASTATILLVALYTRGIASSSPVALAITGVLAMLYGFMIILLQLQDFTLLLGSIGLFVILATVMYLTRRVNWFAVGTER